MKSNDNSNSPTQPPPSDSGARTEEPPSRFALPRGNAAIPFFSLSKVQHHAHFTHNH